ncbi:hypothetical protein LMH73_027025 [Vibrio splendidus]|nr:hypothetical protein [Vibrio splendidus]MCC4882951.1 hypothetical protein [Vibrio splendidus]
MHKSIDIYSDEGQEQLKKDFPSLVEHTEDYYGLSERFIFQDKEIYLSPDILKECSYAEVSKLLTALKIEGAPIKCPSTHEIKSNCHMFIYKKENTHFTPHGLALMAGSRDVILGQRIQAQNCIELADKLAEKTKITEQKNVSPLTKYQAAALVNTVEKTKAAKGDQQYNFTILDTASKKETQIFFEPKGNVRIVEHLGKAADHLPSKQVLEFKSLMQKAKDALSHPQNKHYQEIVDISNISVWSSHNMTIENLALTVKPRSSDLSM